VNCLCGTLATEPARCRFEGRDLAGQSAHQRTRLGWRAASSCRALPQHDDCDNLKVPLLYTVNARRQPLAESESERRCEDC